jgi:hypothetical protein
MRVPQPAPPKGLAMNGALELAKEMLKLQREMKSTIATLIDGEKRLHKTMEELAVVVIAARSTVLALC